MSRCFRKSLEQECTILGDLPNGLRDISTDLRCVCDKRLSRCFDFDDEVAVVVAPYHEIRLLEAVKIGLGPHLKGHWVEELRISLKKVLEHALIIRVTP